MRRMAYLPLVGIVVGSAAGLVFLGSTALLGSKALAIILSITITLLLTGAFLERATLARVIALLINYQSLLLLPSRSIPLVLIAAHAFSRFAAGSMNSGSGGGLRFSDKNIRSSIIMAALGMLPLVLVGSLLFLLLVPLLWLVRTIAGTWLSSKEGGYTSDRLLTTQHIVEVSFYVLVVIAYKFTFDITPN